MVSDVEQIALADAMQLHNERLKIAGETCQRLRSELEAAEIRRIQVMEARIHFMRYVRPAMPDNGRIETGREAASAPMIS